MVIYVILTTLKCVYGYLQTTLVSSIQSRLDADSFVLPGMLTDSNLLPSVSSPDFSSLCSLPPLSIPSLPLGGMSGDAISSMAGLASSSALATDKSSSRNSYSPAMSDSGISLDAGSSGTAGQPSPPQGPVNIVALAKLGTVNVNGQGTGPATDKTSQAGSY